MVNHAVDLQSILLEKCKVNVEGSESCFVSIIGKLYLWILVHDRYGVPWVKTIYMSVQWLQHSNMRGFLCVLLHPSRYLDFFKPLLLWSTWIFHYNFWIRRMVPICVVVSPVTPQMISSSNILFFGHFTHYCAGSHETYPIACIPVPHHARHTYTILWWCNY